MSDKQPAPIRLTDWQMAVIEDALNDATASLKHVTDWLISAGIVAPPPPIDPRERALYLRKHRNTGPGKPIQAQRRKR